MIKEFPQADFFGGKLDYAVYYPQTPSNHWLVFLVGKGELGLDGTNLPALYKYGFPKLAKEGKDFDFNILMIQPKGSYYNIHKALLPWIQMEFKPSKVILYSISLGAIENWDQLNNDRYGVIKAMVSLSGKPSGGVAAVPTMEPIPIYAYHGNADTVVDYGQALKVFNAYKALHPDLITIDIQNTGHGGWDSVSSYGGPLHLWIQNQFGPEEPDNDYSKGYLDGLEKAKVSIDSLINVNFSK